MKNLPRLILLCAFTALASLRAEVVPAPLFTDNAVLQRDKPIPVWGTADAGEKVSVSFAGQSLATTADASGRWRVDLAPLPANATPATLVIQGNNTVSLSNILVGEVWLASGQSNMEWIVNKTFDAALDIPASARFPLIRHIQIEKKVSDSPVATARGTWKVAGPATTGEFSAVGYFFALEVNTTLNVPVGIIHSSWGGTPVESWMSPASYQTIPAEAAAVQERWSKTVAAFPAAKAKYEADLAGWEAKKAAAQVAGKPFNKPAPRAPSGPGHQNTPAGLNNGMIAPLAPYALRGALWYQGESNAARASEYHALFSAMITGWRTQFAQGDFPFYWVQLANYKASGLDGTEWAFLREAQTKTLALPATGQAVITDLGDVNDIHPRNKKDVGRRLARLALARTYAQPIPDSGPVFAKTERDGAGLRVSFTELHGGLRAPLNTLSGFELAGEDKVFKPADAKIEKDTVFVTSAEVPAPVAVRYAWRNAPVAGLFNGEGLPAVPFRSDTW
jgi:sialate O-acetylesterase